MRNITNLIRNEIEDMGRKYKTVTIEEARQCYVQYVDLIVEDAPKRERNELLNYWNELITSD